MERGLISLDDKLVDIIDIDKDNFSSNISIYHLLTHTSGIADDADEEAGESYEEIWREKPNYQVRDIVDLIPQFIYKEPNFNPGEGCQ